MGEPQIDRPKWGYNWVYNLHITGQNQKNMEHGTCVTLLVGFFLSIGGYYTKIPAPKKPVVQ